MNSLLLVSPSPCLPITIMELKLILTGLGGQGVVFLTRLLAQTATDLGHVIMVSETHGMSQRGGSVMSHLRVGGGQAPLIRKGTADVLIALEVNEAVRNLSYLRPGGTVFVNSEDGLPATVRPHLERLNIQAHHLPASKLAVNLGSAAMTNTVMAGFAHPFPIDAIQAAIVAMAPRGREQNLQALAAGFQASSDFVATNGRVV